MTKTYLLILLVTLLSGCSFNQGRYQQANDSKPTRLPTASELKDAVPRIEPKSRGGNRNYTVRGKHYKVLNSAEGFSDTGIASWYGSKFHGHLTSNGEIYDMYGMSAAHKSLPLPTYVKVTNLSNDKSVIVRVNDRGPFHQSRIIDLSYSAAYKIGMLKTGTAKVKVEAITSLDKPKPVVNKVAVAQTEKPSITETASPKGTTYIQVFATKDKLSAQNKAKALAPLFDKQVITPEHQGIYRIQIGPFSEKEDISDILSSLKQMGYPNAYRRKILQ